MFPYKPHLSSSALMIEATYILHSIVAEQSINTHFFPFQMLIRWNVPLERGYFFAVVHYFQPFHPSTTVKVIMNTFYSSIAGKIELKFCPHVEGCRAAVTSEDASSDRFTGLYLSGSVISATIRFPKGLSVWIVSIVNTKRLSSVSRANSAIRNMQYNYRAALARKP